jgi:manganese transport protein
VVLRLVVHSDATPSALVPGLASAPRREVMGPLANPGWLTALAGTLAALIIGLNVLLLIDLAV